ncbi:MAG: S8 family serine peptidase, partial [candidate division Zixibacteria bacterium]|nr:S8 family serine peptidase [candidate division Zixibacteria bacterium]
MNSIRPKLLLLAIILLALLCASAGAVYRSPGPTGPVPGKFIVKLKPNVRPQMLSQSLSKEDHLYRFSNVVVRDDLKGGANWDRVYVLVCSGQSLGADGVAAMLGKENVEYVEQDYYLEFFDYPDDSLFSNQWYLHNEGQEYLGIERFEGNKNDRLVLKSGTPGKDIHLAALYGDPPVQTARVVVAIVDTGIDLFHPELAGRLWKNRDEIPGNGVDDDHNGFVDDTIGYDISGDLLTLFDPVGDNDPTDSVGHGTHIAGIIGANADGRGVVGIAPEVEIMPVKIRPNATNAVGAAGIVYAVNAGAQVINISWGTPFESGLLREAIAFA